MQKILKIMFGVFLLLALSGCSDKPSDVAKSFTQAMAKNDLEKASKFATKETMDMMKFASGLGGIEKNPKFKYKLIEEKIIDDNRAKVTYKDASTDKTDTLELVKVDGDWKVAIGKK